IRDPGGARRLPRRVLAQPGLEHVAEDHLLDLIRRDARAPQGLADGEGAELGRPEAGQTTLEPGDRGAAGTGDDDFLQGGVLRNTAEGRRRSGPLATKARWANELQRIARQLDWTLKGSRASRRCR